MSVSRDRATARTRTEGTVADAKSENIGLLWTFGDIVKPDYYYLNHNCSGGDDAMLHSIEYLLLNLLTLKGRPPIDQKSFTK